MMHDVVTMYNCIIVFSTGLINYSTVIQPLKKNSIGYFSDNTAAILKSMQDMPNGSPVNHFILKIGKIWAKIDPD